MILALSDHMVGGGEASHSFPAEGRARSCWLRQRVGQPADMQPRPITKSEIWIWDGSGGAPPFDGTPHNSSPHYYGR